MEVRSTVYTEPNPGEEVVISGISGRFPASDNVRLLEKNLLEKAELLALNNERWSTDYKQLPRRSGKISNLSKFDASFFGIHPKQTESMDPMGRILMEHAYEAIVDAGINPKQLRGTKTAVITSCCFSESEKTFFYERIMPSGLGITGCSRSMLSNRITYWLGIHGPSITIDTACSSSLVALEQGYHMIRSGRCDAALICGSNLSLHPYLSLQFARLGVLSPDGYCKTFDDKADGYARSEAISVVLLQKAKDAKRNYATLVHGMTNSDGFKEQGITFPSAEIQSVLFKEFYEECGLPPTILSYLEAHGTGTTVGDPEELAAIDKVFCKDRVTPLKIGSVKSNIGHTEPVSGLVSIIKVILAMESNVISPNMHYKTPRKGVKALEEGRLQVIKEPTPWNGGYAGVNSFGFGGVNCHVLLKSNTKEKINHGIPKDNLARLVAVSGRTEEAVTTLLDDIESRPLDAEYISLFHEIHAQEISGHLYRGYSIISAMSSEDTVRAIEEYNGSRRPICFVFSGMGSQWSGMGGQLLKFPIFAEAIQKCDSVLKSRGLNIYDILTSKRKEVFDNILNSFVGIAAVQIGLVDLLTSLGVVPDHIIGHSVGELGCAYADGCFTFEETILSAYSRGLASIETELIDGSMAAIGCGYEEMKSVCPPDIEVACHNSSKSCTISGPRKSIETFVAHLQSKGLFAKEVACSNIAYHSRYIAPAGPKLLTYLKQIIIDPKARSEKWISTSVPQSKWLSPSAKFSSAEYHTNNLLNPVLFEETATLIPKDAIAIEIAPHGLLQAILRRSMPSTVTNVPLMLREHKDNSRFFLQALGKLYNSGVQLQLAKLYPRIDYPVSRGTPMISPLIKWVHTEDWFVASYEKEGNIGSGEREVCITLSNDVYAYLSGHIIDGRNLIPATEYLLLIWQTLGIITGENYTDTSVVFEDIKFLRATHLPKNVDANVQLRLMVQHGTGQFEIVDGSVAIVTGRIRHMMNPLKDKVLPEVVQQYKEKYEIESQEESMTAKDVYKELKLRGYQYSGLFRGIRSASITGTKGHIEWSDNWVTFLDSILQLTALSWDSRGLFLPTSIEKLVIDTKQHNTCISEIPSDEKQLPAYFNKDWDILICGGVEIRGLRTTAITRRRQAFAITIAKTTTGSVRLSQPNGPRRFVVHTLGGNSAQF
ncbi:hypothetical protein KM043_017904 [Ampulex compressa]|nr:hypothetical protein KM043_017904 [Ampulex compressa]